MRADAACVGRKATCMRLSIITEDERVSPQPSPGSGLQGEMLALVPWRCMSDKLYSQEFV